MAYGDNRSSIVTDAFPTSIDSNWEIGAGNWFDMKWVSSGIIDTVNFMVNSAIRRTTGAFTADQYCSVTVNSHTAGGNWIAAKVRMGAGTDNTAYIGYANTDSNEYSIWESNAAGTLSNLITVAGGGDVPLGVGDILTLEVEGTTIRLGAKVGAAADAEKTTFTDATLTGGNPGCGMFVTSGATGSRIASVEMGNIGSTTGQGTNNLTVSGIHADVVATMATLLITPDLDFIGPGSVITTTTDAEFLSDMDTTVLEIGVTPVNNNPTTQVTLLNTQFTISPPISASSPGARITSVQIVATETSTDLDVTVMGVAGTIGNGTDDLTINGAVEADILSTLATLQYTPPPGFIGSDPLTITTTNVEPLTDVDTTIVNTINPVGTGAAPGRRRRRS